MPAEYADLLAFVIATLTDDAQLVAELPVHDGGPNVHAYQLPASAPFPGVIVTAVPLDDNQHQSDARNSSALVDIKLVVEDAPTDSNYRASRRIDDLFRYVVARVHGGHQFSARRRKPIHHREPHPADAERFVFNLGGTYRFGISAALNS